MTKDEEQKTISNRRTKRDNNPEGTRRKIQKNAWRTRKKEDERRTNKGQVKTKEEEEQNETTIKKEDLETS